MSVWQDRPLADLLDEFGLAGLDERPFAADGWSGSTFTTIDRGPDRFVIKRVSPATDWIVRSTRDHAIREAWLAGQGLGDAPWWQPAAGPLTMGFLGAASDAEGAAVVLMPDLTEALGAWGAKHGAALPTDAADVLIDRIAALHALPWSEALEARGVADGWAPPWCPLRERITLLTPRSAAGYASDGNPVGAIFLRGWDGFDRHAPAAARDLIGRLADDPGPLVGALERLPAVGLHGDIKLANVARQPDDGVTFIDWQMTLRAAVAVELGWFIVTNSAELPYGPPTVLDRYRAAIQHRAGGWHFGRRTHDLESLLGDWDAQVDLTLIVGLLLRGWRKGMDTDAGAILGSGIAAAEDLAWWCQRAVDAAERRL